MPSRQPSRSRGALAITSAGDAPPPAHGRHWMRRLRLALILFVGVLLVAYLAVLALSLFDPQLLGTPQPPNPASLPDALGYPLSIATALSPAWLVGAAVVLVGIYAISVFAVRGGAPNLLPPSLGGKGPHGNGAAVGARPVSPAAPADSQPIDNAVGASGGRLPALDALAAPAHVGATDVPQASSGGRPSAIPVATSLLPDNPSDAASETFVPRIFISHSSLDDAFGQRLVERLRAALGSEDAVWYDSLPGGESAGLAPGDEWWDRINYELDTRNVFLIILTPASMISKWCQDELKLAWSRKNSKSRTEPFVLIPLMLETCDPPTYLTTLQFAYFTTPDRFEESFAQLLQTIRAGRTVEQPVTTVYGPPFDLAQLPLPAHFVGRESELAFLRERLTQSGSMSSIVASINGLGGIGKTGLAAKVIRDLRDEGYFPDGIAVALCQGKTTEADALQILADVLTRFDALRRPPEADDWPGLAEAAMRLLGGKETLVVLDNVEPELPVQLVVTPLREAGATLLLTARQQQTADVVPPEGRLRLDLLSEDEALDLLAKSLGRPAVLDLTHSELEAARRIVTNLDRHTLAVTLAAAYVSDAVGMTLEQLAEQLADPQRALHLPKGEAPDEVKRVFASSYDALPMDAQRLFAAFAAFPTPEFGREAAVALAQTLDIADPERIVELLVRRALATAQGDRLRLHPLIQALAASELAEWPLQQREEAEHAVTTYYADYTNATPDSELAPDEANIIGAIEWAQAHSEDHLLVRLCDGIAGFWRDTGRTFTALRYLPQARDAAKRVAAITATSHDQLLAANIEFKYAQALRRVGRMSEAASAFLDNLTFRRAIKNSRDEGVVLSELGHIAWARGQLEEAQHYLEESLRIAREVGDRRSEGVVLSNLVEIYLTRGRLVEAQRYLEESLQIRREVGDRLGEGVTLSKLGQVSLGLGRLQDAQRYFEAGSEIAREVGNRIGEGVALDGLAHIALESGDLSAAQHYLEESLRIAREVGDRRGEGTALNNLGKVAQDQGRLDEARRYLKASQQIRREVGDRRGEGATLNNLGGVASAQGQLAEAQRLYEESLAIAHETQYAELERIARDNLEGVTAKRRAAGEL
ncbi:MAG TPA: tetratricopeptide repeat protein [Ktedonobacterales bacterium]